MSRLSDDPDVVKFVHTYGVGLHGTDHDPDPHDPRWQQRQVNEFVEFAAQAEQLGFDAIAVTEHHALSMTCPSPHLLLAAAAQVTSRIRLQSAVTVLPLYNPIRVAEEAGTLDLLSGGRFELGLGRGVPGEVQLTAGRDLAPEELGRLWLEDLDLLQLALTERDFTFDGEFTTVSRPTTIATRPLQEPLPIWLGGASMGSMAEAARRGWNIMRNFGGHAEHRKAFEHYVDTAAAHGHQVSGQNYMIERFIAIGGTEDEAERNLGRLSIAFARFISLFLDGELRTVPASDGEFHLDKRSDGRPGRPAIAISGTPDKIVESLLETLAETGARRLIVETFSPDEMRMFAEEVIPSVRRRSAITAERR